MSEIDQINAIVGISLNLGFLIGALIGFSIGYMIFSNKNNGGS